MSKCLLRFQVDGITNFIFFFPPWCFIHLVSYFNRHLSGSMATWTTSRLRSADECAVRHGLPIPAEERPLVHDVSAERRRCVRPSSPPRTPSRRRRFVIRCWRRSRCRSGGRPRQAARWRTRGFRLKGAKWRTASQAALLLRTILHHQKDFVPGE